MSRAHKAAQSALDVLRDPRRSLPAFAQVHDQATGRFRKYDPNRLTSSFQASVLAYLGNPPLTSDGRTKFMTFLTARQMGKSLTAEYGCYPRAAYTPGWDHVCIADTKDRSEYLHRRVHQLHQRWPEEVRAPTSPSREVRQLTFEGGGKMRVLSAESGAVGIGQSPDSFHASECAFWADFGGSMVLIYPSIINRQHALAVFECTPWEANSDWHEHVLLAKRGIGRHDYAFFPFWDGLLNRRPWPKGEPLDTEEQRLLARFGHLGLTPENLAFRRAVMETDPQIRRKPELFGVFYPFDDTACWIAAVNAAIPRHVIEKHQHREMVRWSGPYMEYAKPNPESRYVIGADPCGHAARDHAAFQVVEVHERGWFQSACFADHADPVAFARKLMSVGLRYNKARIVVESNGVGQAVLSLLRDWEYPNLHYESRKKPGFTSTAQSLDKATGWLIDALMDEYVIEDKDTVDQLLTYKADKNIEESPHTEMVRGERSKRRRERHHWDKVSALLMATVACRATSPSRAFRPDSLPLGTAPVHSGVYRFADQAKKWRDMQRARRRKKNPWYKGRRPT